MTKKLFIIFFTLPLCLSAQVWEPALEKDSITITYRDLLAKKRNRPIKGRLQIRIGEQATWVLANDFDRLPAFFKKFKVTSPTGRCIFERADLALMAQPALDSLVSHIQVDTLFFKDVVVKKRMFLRYSKDRERFFSGNHSSSFFKYNWVPLLPVQYPATPVSLTIRGNLFRKVYYKTDKLPTGYAPRLPALSITPCVPYNRFHELRKMNGYGIDNLRYTPYRVPNRETVRQHFELFFDKNSASVNEEMLQPIIRYLQQNDYSILNATIEGYSSPEGTDQLNERLQQKRARVLFNQLQHHNREPILSELVIVKPGYDLFRESIQHSPYQWLNTLTNEELQQKLNSEKILSAELEPYLKSQRKSVLRLVLAKRLEGIEILERFKRDFTRLEKQLTPGNQPEYPATEIEAKLMGMISWLFEWLENGGITSTEVAEILDFAHSSEIVRVLSVYHHIIKFEGLEKRPEDTLKWENISKQYDYTELFLIAQSNLISLIRNPYYIKQRDKLKRQLVDIQTYAFDYVEKGWLSVEALCALDYPDSPGYRNYKLNQLAFLQKLSLHRPVPCEKLTVSPPSSIQTYTDDWLVENQVTNVEPGIAISKTPQGKYLPTCGKEVYSPLLYYLKKLFVQKETSIAQHVITSDSHYEFDIYTLAAYNVQHWRPEVNYFQDREIQFLEMDKLISLLKRTNKRICRYNTDQLYLDYHLKALHYLNVYFEPGNREHSRIGQQSLQYISTYYSRHAAQITPRLSLYLLHQLNAFHWIPGKNDSTWYAWSLINKIAQARALTVEEYDLYTLYRKYHAPTKIKKRG
jgi:hypothetical protein